jgi:hypothetical protein
MIVNKLMRIITALTSVFAAACSERQEERGAAASTAPSTPEDVTPLHYWLHLAGLSV